ncbi:crosslink repair DNA glycosylase YcaQ family protein [Actinocrispum sp. NPDC049592]|uniref:winged helix-turn-helix domain-containing protein n=1 Tax=Actinocrispum sp. NPDC049592 TaxID=3154835 RepID=UPI0034385065
MSTEMSAAAARRTAVAAQGFTDPRPTGVPSRRHLLRVLSRTQLIQLDSVNVAVRAHYMPLFSRLGAYPMSLIDDAAWSHSVRRPRLLVEKWAHEASLIPMDDWPLLHLTKRQGWWKHYREVVERSPGLVQDVLDMVKERGPIGAGTLERELVGDVKREKGTWWDRSDVKHICEYLFGIGELTTGARRSFERLYDLTERVVPPEVLTRKVAPDEGARQLVERSARALGVATEPELRDYYRLAPDVNRQAILDLVDAGILEAVTVTGWSRKAYKHIDARTPRRISGRALLCPFDPLIWERDRTERIFDFRYRIEIYVPEAKREFGYYVFPFLLDGNLVGRVDLKADRAAGVLRVPGAFAESGVDTARVVTELAAELKDMATWLGLSGVAVGTRGTLAPTLKKLTR